MKHFTLTIIFVLMSIPFAFANPRGGGNPNLDDYLVAGFTRPCCSFGMNTVGQALGIVGVIDKRKLGKHFFARENKNVDNVGTIYTCRAGFVDVSHLRDNADWSGHIYLNLPEWLGSGREIVGRNEGGFKKRNVYFPKISKAELATLTEDDLEQLAVSIGFSYALLHEIPTSFKIAVSAPATLISYETSSAFSVEDAYSNLLGNKLGAKAARSDLPFNEAMTKLISSTLNQLGSQPEANTLKAFELTRNDWWIQGFQSEFENVLRRDFSYQGEVRPRRIANAPFCSNEPIKNLSIPEKLSNGRSVHDYYEIRGEMKPKLKRSLQELGVNLQGNMTQTDFPEIIEAIKKEFVSILGPVILKY